MTTKGPSRKQVIVPISNDNKISFMKNSSIHVTNINGNLKKEYQIRYNKLISFIKKLQELPSSQTKLP